MKPNKIEAILSIKSDAEVTSKADGSLVWHDGNPTNITDEQIATKLAELQADYDAKEYQRKREKEYPSLQDCIHAILDDDLDNLQVKRQAVKEKYPK
tara:strand:- start:99 stop:389 length:291 start_codon:yes stop_codon:yes gene_type:complete